MHIPLQLKFTKSDSQTLTEVIRIVEKFDATQKLTAMLIPSMVSKMSNEDRCFVCGQTGFFAITASIHSVAGVMNSAALYKTAPTRFLPQEHLTTQIGLIPGHDTLTPKGTDHNPPIIDTDMGDTSPNHNHTTTVTGAAAATTWIQSTPIQPLHLQVLPFGSWMSPTPLTLHHSLQA